MNPRFTQLCLWTDESISLCRELQKVLSQERQSLLAFRGEDLAETTMAKEVTVAKILQSRKKLKEAGAAWFGVSSTEELTALLGDADKQVWITKQKDWKAEWKAICVQVERNQLFLKHSQKNLGRLIENWRRLLGQNPLYSSKGQKIESPSTGKVFEAKF
jgi:flagellar biosynthesis/type III secretory pathway chaperone